MVFIESCFIRRQELELAEISDFHALFDSEAEVKPGLWFSQNHALFVENLSNWVDSVVSMDFSIGKPK